MGKTRLVREQDVRAMLSVMADITQLPPDPTRRTQYLMERIADLVRARAIWSTRWRTDGPKLKVQPYAVLQAGFTPEELRAAIETAAIDPLHDYVIEHLYAQPSRRAVFVTNRLPSARKRGRADAAAKNQRETGGDLDVIINCPAIQEGHFAALGMQRANGDRRFSEREIQIASLLWEQATTLHAKPLAAVDEKLWGAKLPRRLHQVLQLVLAGQVVKQIAKRLALSEHTINEYLKDLYRRFGVSGRAELMAGFVQRRWSDEG